MAATEPAHVTCSPAIRECNPGTRKPG